MRVRSIIIALAVFLVLGGLVFLFALVTEGPSDAVPQEKLTQALQRYERTQAAEKAASVERPQPPRPGTPELLLSDVPEEDAGPPPEPWQARSKPAHAPDLHEGISDDDLAARLDEAQTLYRSRRYKEAIAQSVELLDEVPDNMQLKRIIVRAACIEGDIGTAGTYIEQLPERDKPFLRSHCKRYGVDMAE